MLIHHFKQKKIFFKSQNFSASDPLNISRGNCFQDFLYFAQFSLSAPNFIFLSFKVLTSQVM